MPVPKASARTLSILVGIAPLLEASRRASGYYPACVAIRALIADRHGDKTASTLYHGRLAVLLQAYTLPLYSGRGAREFASVNRRMQHAPLCSINFWQAHASPFHTILDWLHWRLASLSVTGEIRVRSDLCIVRTDTRTFKIYYSNKSMLVGGDDYAHAVARLHVALLFYSRVEKQVRDQPEKPHLQTAEERRAEVSQLYKSGHTYSDIARLTGIAVSTVVQDVIRSGARERKD